MLGILQYIGPILQFVLALTVFDDPMDPTRWAGFLLVWVALAVFTVDALRQVARVRAELAEPPLL